MTLVDTTVWIDFFRGLDTSEVRELERMMVAGDDICLCGVILTEVLQGIREDKAYDKTLAIFDSFLLLPMTRRVFVSGARIYRAARSKGLTIRNPVDCMIAAAAIEHGLPLLHNDRDFDAIASLGELKTVRTSGTPRSRATRQPGGD